MSAGRVLIVGAEENPVLPIVESLSAQGVRVHVASHERVCLGFFSRYAERRFVYPSPSDDPDGFVDALLGYVEREGFDVAIALGEIPGYLLCKHKEAFSRHTRVPVVDLETYMQCRDKTRTMKAAARAGVPTPRTWFPEEEGIESVAGRIDYPAVLKPNTSDGARGISYPRGADELIAQYRRTRETFGPCHVQEYIPQTGMQYKAEVLLDRSSRVRAWCVYSKLRWYPPTGGSSTLNCTVDRRDILDRAAEILTALGWYGMGDCDFIEDPRDGVPKLMEINPRFTRSIKICVRAGVDFPFLLYRMARDEEVPEVLDYRVGLFLRYLPGDLMWLVRSENRFRTQPSFFRFLGKNLQYEILSLRDPAPALAYLLSAGASLLDRKKRQFRLR